MELTEEKIKNISEKLKTIPKKNQFSKREAIELLKNDITNLQKKGYSLKEIKKFLDEEGLKMSIATFRSYLPSDKKQKKENKKQKRKQETKKEKLKKEPIEKDGFVESDPEEI